MPDPQSFKNHAKFVPLYHGFAFPVAAINFVWSVYRAYTRPSWDTAIAMLLGAALIVIFFFARIFALSVQDRIIRLEMRLRMREQLPADLVARIPEFTTSQLIALRFASDAELPALARKVLDDRVTNRKAIKQMITDWQADHQRV
jgi:hypothetical protein